MRTVWRRRSVICLLAVAQAAGYMIDTGMPAREYISLLEARAAEILDHGEQ